MKTKKIVFYGMSICLALILSYVESLIPFSFGIPGIKLGLSNLVIMIILYAGNFAGAFVVSALKAIITGFMFGSLSSIIYSLAGGILSLVLMAFAKKLKVFSEVGVSVIGGIFHNMGQLFVAAFVVGYSVVNYYIPYLLIAGAFTGVLIGVITRLVLPNIKRMSFFGGFDDSLY